MNVYADAITILEDRTIDSRSLVVEIAKKFPSVLVEAHKALSESTAWLMECKRLTDEGRKIDAIRLCREATGLGLAEAKRYVEGL